MAEDLTCREDIPASLFDDIDNAKIPEKRNTNPGNPIIMTPTINSSSGTPNVIRFQPESRLSYTRNNEGNYASYRKPAFSHMTRHGAIPPVVMPRTIPRDSGSENGLELRPSQIQQSSTNFSSGIKSLGNSTAPFFPPKREFDSRQVVSRSVSGGMTLQNPMQLSGQHYSTLIPPASKVYKTVNDSQGRTLARVTMPSLNRLSHVNSSQITRTVIPVRTPVAPPINRPNILRATKIQATAARTLQQKNLLTSDNNTNGSDLKNDNKLDVKSKDVKNGVVNLITATPTVIVPCGTTVLQGATQPTIRKRGRKQEILKDDNYSIGPPVANIVVANPIIAKPVINTTPNSNETEPKTRRRGGGRKKKLEIENNNSNEPPKKRGRQKDSTIAKKNETQNQPSTNAGLEQISVDVTKAQTKDERIQESIDALFSSPVPNFLDSFNTSGNNSINNEVGKKGKGTKSPRIPRAPKAPKEEKPPKEPKPTKATKDTKKGKDAKLSEETKTTPKGGRGRKNVTEGTTANKVVQVIQETSDKKVSNNKDAQKQKDSKLKSNVIATESNIKKRLNEINSQNKLKDNTRASNMRVLQLLEEHKKSELVKTMNKDSEENGNKVNLKKGKIVTLPSTSPIKGVSRGDKNNKNDIPISNSNTNKDTIDENSSKNTSVSGKSVRFNNELMYLNMSSKPTKKFSLPESSKGGILKNKSALSELLQKLLAYSSKKNNPTSGSTRSLLSENPLSSLSQENFSVFFNKNPGAVSVGNTTIDIPLDKSMPFIPQLRPIPKESPDKNISSTESQDKDPSNEPDKDKLSPSLSSKPRGPIIPPPAVAGPSGVKTAPYIPPTKDTLKKDGLKKDTATLTSNEGSKLNILKIDSCKQNSSDLNGSKIDSGKLNIIEKNTPLINVANIDLANTDISKINISNLEGRKINVCNTNDEQSDATKLTQNENKLTKNNLTAEDLKKVGITPKHIIQALVKEILKRNISERQFYLKALQIYNTLDETERSAVKVLSNFLTQTNNETVKQDPKYIEEMKAKIAQKEKEIADLENKDIKAKQSKLLQQMRKQKILNMSKVKAKKKEIKITKKNKNIDKTINKLGINKKTNNIISKNKEKKSTDVTNNKDTLFSEFRNEVVDDIMKNSFPLIPKSKKKVLLKNFPTVQLSQINEEEKIKPNLSKRFLKKRNNIRLEEIKHRKLVASKEEEASLVPANNTLQTTQNNSLFRHKRLDMNYDTSYGIKPYSVAEAKFIKKYKLSEAFKYIDSSQVKRLMLDFFKKIDSPIKYSRKAFLHQLLKNRKPGGNSKAAIKASKLIIKHINENLAKPIEKPFDLLERCEILRSNHGIMKSVFKPFNIFSEKKRKYLKTPSITQFLTNSKLIHGLAWNHIGALHPERKQGLIEDIKKLKKIMPINQHLINLYEEHVLVGFEHYKPVPSTYYKAVYPILHPEVTKLFTLVDEDIKPNISKVYNKKGRCFNVPGEDFFYSHGSIKERKTPVYPQLNEFMSPILGIKLDEDFSKLENKVQSLLNDDTFKKIADMSDEEVNKVYELNKRSFEGPWLHNTWGNLAHWGEVVAGASVKADFAEADTINTWLDSYVKYLSFNKNVYSTGRRTDPQLQLQHVGGDAHEKEELEFAQCNQIGYDVLGPVFRCYDKDNKILEVSHFLISCEGYDDADDEYILEGSCVLKYTLGKVSPKNIDNNENEIGLWLFFGFVAVMLIISFLNRRQNNDNENNQGTINDDNDIVNAENTRFGGRPDTDPFRRRRVINNHITDGYDESDTMEWSSVGQSSNR
uniref:Store-operated calcium entry-associated regulatory factor n=1 Tax=Parastrongyloides trichosuri TaxID=131310 RepID=A0A0N4ZHF2_PARTI